MIYKKNKVIFKKIIKKNFKNKIGNFIDFTFGNGCHSKIIIKEIKKGYLNSFEINKENYKKSNIKNINFFIFNKCFTNIRYLKIKKVNIALIDIGFTENQILNFNSFKNEKVIFYSKKIGLKKNPLDVINFYNYKNLLEIFIKFDKIFFCKKICKEILKERKKKIILYYSQIKNIVLKVYKKKYKKSRKNIFSKYYNAIINYCFETEKKIKKLLNYIINIIKKKGKIIIISFNSFESRIIKNFFNKKNFFSLIKKNKKINKVIRIYERKK
ncbi:16S rRNA (cytosine(1402)-N(4))-methyltransferase [Candidatus Vidania fulgoroideorum]